MSDEIKPRIDEDGVGWCDAGCPQSRNPGPINTTCLADGGEVRMHGRAIRRAFGSVGEVCPVHARRMAQWAGRARCCIADGSIPLRWEELLCDYPGKQGGA